MIEAREFRHSWVRSATVLVLFLAGAQWGLGQDDALLSQQPLTPPAPRRDALP